MNSVYVLIFISGVFIASCSQILLKKGASSKSKSIYFNKYTIVGYAILLISSAISLIGYKGVNLSFGILLESLAFIFVPTLSYFILKENINKKTIIKMGLLLIGIIIYVL